MKITFRDRPPVFVDLEASGLGPSSYPIEVGWSADDVRNPSSFLIQPAPEWSYADFTDAELAIHNIPYGHLVCDGVSTSTACARLAAAWTGAILISDNPGADSRWLRRLYDAACTPFCGSSSISTSSTPP